MGDTLERVERTASDALLRRLENPFLGGRPLLDAPPAEGAIIATGNTGDIQHVDMQALQACGVCLEAQVFLHLLPGSFVAPGTPLLSVGSSSLDEEQVAALRDGVTIGPTRSFEEDPRFGLIVLTEIASRALSPAINDPGTVIDILGRHVRNLAQWRMREDAEVRFDRV